MSGQRLAEESIRLHSKSFSLASRLLPKEVRDHAVVVYAWCRRADDHIDDAPPETGAQSLEQLESELGDVYGDGALQDPVLEAFRITVRDRRIPRAYPRDLLAGMAMDVEGRRYESMDELLEYCYCVAGAVGLMMCHVMGVRDDDALSNAAHLGIAMQLTNICRDVQEDWDRGRLYLPDSLLARHGAAGLADRLGGPFPVEARDPAAHVIAELLGEADRYYSSGDDGLSALSSRCALAIRTASRVYSSIGGQIRKKECDPLAGRAFVPTRKKLQLVAVCLAEEMAAAPSRIVRPRGELVMGPGRLVSFPQDVLPL